MAYEKNIWANGVVGGTKITAEKLNYMEEGIYDNSVSIKNNENSITKLSEKIEALNNHDHLWNGKVETSTDGWFPKENEIISLSKNVSECLKGITLVWYGFNPTTGKRIDAIVAKQFISKEDVANGIYQHIMTMAFADFTHVGVKLVYIYDDRIEGSAYNTKTGTKNGITYDNNYFILGDVYAE